MSHLHTRFFLTLFGSLAVFALGAVVVAHIDDGASPIVHIIQGFRIFPSLALCIGIVTYPITRRLTQRLERLQLAVETLGAGDLSTRVAVEGKDEVARLAESFNRSAARIEELVGAHKRLLANTSHELRTPLTRMRVALALMKPSDDPQRRVDLDRDIAELDQLIDEIMLTSRLDAGAELDVNEDVDLLALAAEECARYQDVQLEGAALTCRGDPRLLRRLLRNLLDNAQRHGTAPVNVQLSPRPPFAEITISDHGATIPADQASRLFEPFYRRGGASGNIGSGLGLALVRQIAQRHSGDACYRATPLCGNSFIVHLPMSQSDSRVGGINDDNR